MTVDEAETRLIEILRFYKAETLCQYVEMEREIKALICEIMTNIQQHDD